MKISSIVEGILNFQSMEETLLANGVCFKRKGNKLWACCPFHSEKTPSFIVNVEKIPQTFKCFSCGQYGNVINFYQKIWGMDNRATIKQLVQEFGIGSKATSSFKRKEISLTQQIAYQKAVKFEKEVETTWFRVINTQKMVRQWLKEHGQECVTYSDIACLILNLQSKLEIIIDFLQYRDDITMQILGLEKAKEVFVDDDIG